MPEIKRKPRKPPKNPGPPKPQPTALPFDLGAAQRRRSLLQGRMNMRTDYRRNVQDANRYTTNAIRDINQEAPNVYRNILNNAAGRGMAFSSGYGYNYGQAANQMANQKANLTSELGVNLDRMREDKERAMANYQYQLSNVMQGQAQGAERNAGNLGFGRGKLTKKKKNRRP